jgi:hypothetical protein
LRKSIEKRSISPDECEEEMRTTAQQDDWLRRQIWRRFWCGPAAVSAFVSLTIQVMCTALSFADSREVWNICIYMLLLNSILSLILMATDTINARRNHRLGIIRSSVSLSRDRIQEIGLRFELLDRFVNSLWLSSEVEHCFKRIRIRSIEMLIEALDILSRISASYGRRGRKVFVMNQEPIFTAIRALECLPFEDAATAILEPVKDWLKTPLKFDPEGFAISVH